MLGGRVPLAGAGSGKTSVLIERIVQLLARSFDQGTPLDLTAIVALTFTRKAAAELRGRFHLALEEELTRAKEPARRARILAAVSNLERFFAGTIHSFCAHLLRQRHDLVPGPPGWHGPTGIAMVQWCQRK